MDKIFLTVLNMTFTASFVITAIIIARLFLKRTPKVISYILWAVAGFRLVFPFSFESVLSLMPFSAHPIPQDILEQALPRIETGIPAIDVSVSSILPVASQSGVNALRLMLTAGSIIWLAGVAVMLIYSGISMLALNRRLKNAALIENNIYEANVKTPFVTGLFRPKIYLPVNLPDSEREYIILHERSHIKRRDNFIKLFAYLILSLHWFNPFVWAAFILMSLDMEMSCDENVLKKSDGKNIKDYSMSILSLATERYTINIYPLAFGEGDTKRRIKNVLNYRKHSKIKIAVTLIMVAALTVGFAFNKISAENSSQVNDFKLVVEFIQRLHFFTDGDISEDNISRAEMAFYVAALYDADPFEFYQYETVPETIERHDGSEHEVETRVYDDPWVKNYEAAIEKCIAEGVMPASWFADPGADVTLHDALKMLVTALRYEELDDYIAKASAKEVRLIGEHAVFPFTGVRADKTLTKNEAVMLVYNFILSEFATEIHAGIEPVWNDEIGRYENKPLYYKYVISMYNISMAKSAPTASAVIINGKEIVFDSYIIEGSNYFKLRDLAYALNGTEKQFDIETVWQVTAGDTVYELEPHRYAMHILTGQPYTPVGGEMAERGKIVITAFSGSRNIQLLPNNFWIMFNTFIINGEDYFGIREVAKALDFSVVWDETANTIAIDTSKPYN